MKYLMLSVFAIITIGAVYCQSENSKSNNEKIGNITSALDSLPANLVKLIGYNGYSRDDLVGIYNNSKEHELKKTFMDNTRLNESDYFLYCSCVLEKEVKNHRYQNGKFINMNNEDAQRYGAACMSELGFLEEIQKRHGSFSNPNQAAFEGKTFSHLEHLAGINNWSKTNINALYETCDNNNALKVQFDEAGYSALEYQEYCTCLINTIVKKELSKAQLEKNFQKRAEKYAVDCVNNLN